MKVAKVFYWSNEGFLSDLHAVYWLSDFLIFSHDMCSAQLSQVDRVGEISFVATDFEAQRTLVIAAAALVI